MIKKIGKIGKLNQKANRKLKQLWIEKDIRYCEYPTSHLCTQGMGLQNAHKHKRVWYRNKPGLLFDYGQVVRVCQRAHDLMETNRRHTLVIFKRLRGSKLALDSGVDL